MKMNDLEFLSFKDFIVEQERQKDWTIICRGDKIHENYFDTPDDCAIISFLAPNDNDVIEK